MERAALRCLTQSGGQIFAVRLFDGERVHEQFEPFIRGGNVEQKLQNAFIDFERRVKQRTRPNFKEAPVAERPQAAHGAPMGLVQHSDRKPESRPGCRRGRRIRLGSGTGRGKARIQCSTGAEQQDVHFEVAERKYLAQPLDGIPASGQKRLVMIVGQGRGVRPMSVLNAWGNTVVRGIKLHAALQLREHALQLIPQCEGGSIPHEGHALTSAWGRNWPKVGLPEVVSRVRRLWAPSTSTRSGYVPTAMEAGTVTVICVDVAGPLSGMGDMGIAWSPM